MPVSPTRLRFLDQENKILVKNLKDLKTNTVFSNIVTPFTDSALEAALKFQQDLLKLQGVLPDLFSMIDGGLFTPQRLASILSGLNFSGDLGEELGAFFTALSSLPPAAANAFVSALWEGVLDSAMLDPSIIAISGKTPEQIVVDLIGGASKDFINGVVNGTVDKDDFLKLPGILTPGVLKPDEIDSIKDLVDTIPVHSPSTPAGSSGAASKPVSGSTAEPEKWRQFPVLYTCFLREYCDRWLERTFYKTFPISSLTADNSDGVASFLTDHLGRSPMFSLEAAACAVHAVHWQCVSALRASHSPMGSPASQWTKIANFCELLITASLQGVGGTSGLPGAEDAMKPTLAEVKRIHLRYPNAALNYHIHNVDYKNVQRKAFDDCNSFVNKYINSFPVEELATDKRIALGKPVMCAILRCVQALEIDARPRYDREQRDLLALACNITQHFYGRIHSATGYGYYRNDNFAKDLAALVNMMRGSTILNSEQDPEKEEDVQLKKYFKYCLSQLPSSAGISYFESDSFYNTFSGFFPFSHEGLSFHDLARYRKSRITSGLVVG